MIKGQKLASIPVANWALLIKLSSNSRRFSRPASCVIDSARQELDTGDNVVSQTGIDEDGNRNCGRCRKWNSKVGENNFHVLVQGPDVDDNAEKTHEIDFTMTKW